MNALNDIHQVEALLIEIVRSSFLNFGSENDSIFYHVRSAKGQIIDVIDEIEECTAKDLKLNIEDNVISTYLPRLQFTLGQIENIIVVKSRRRYTLLHRYLSRRSLMDDGIVEIRPTNFDFSQILLVMLN